MVRAGEARLHASLSWKQQGHNNEPEQDDDHDDLRFTKKVGVDVMDPVVSNGLPATPLWESDEVALSTLLFHHDPTASEAP